MPTKSIGPAAGCTGLGHLKTNLFIADYVKNNPRFHIREISKVMYHKRWNCCDGFDCTSRTTLKVIIQSNKTGERYSRKYCYNCASRYGFSSYLIKEEE